MTDTLISNPRTFSGPAGTFTTRPINFDDFLTDSRCGRCGANAGEPCVMKRATRGRPVHTKRMDAALRRYNNAEYAAREHAELSADGQLRIGIWINSPAGKRAFAEYERFADMHASRTR